MRDACELLGRLARERRALLRGDFTLSSGRRSGIYVDLRRLLGDGHAFLAALTLLQAFLSRELEEADYIIGVATAGIPWATALALLSGKPMLYVRSVAKAHGTESRVEGGEPRGSCLVIDDVATTGNSLARAIKALECKCARISAAVLVDREEGAYERLASMGVTLRALLTLKELVSCAEKHS